MKLLIIKRNNPSYGRQRISQRVRKEASIDKSLEKRRKNGTFYSGRSCPTAENPTHCRLAPPRNALHTVDLPHHQTPYSSWTNQTAEHPTQCGPAPPQNPLLTVDMPHLRTPCSPWTCPIWNTLLTQRIMTFQKNCKGRGQIDISHKSQFILQIGLQADLLKIICLIHKNIRV